jgi:hypothetical protein
MGLSNAERQAGWRERREQRLAELEAVIAKLKAENEKAAEARAANPVTDWLVQENAKLRRQLAEARSRLHSITHVPKGAVFVAKDDLRIIRACLHPDGAQSPAARHRCEAASKAFNALPIRAV